MKLNRRFRLLASLCVVLLAMSLAGCAEHLADEAAADSAPPARYATVRASLPSEGPWVRIREPGSNERFDLYGPAPTAVLVRYDFAPHPDDETGGLLLIVDREEPVPVGELGDPLTLIAGIGLHSVTLVVTDDDGVPYDMPEAYDTVPFKVSILCTNVEQCNDGNPCSADYCFVTGVERRCQYGADSAHPSCCLNRYDCDGFQMCVDIFPVYGPDGFYECVECDGTPDNCPPRPCERARCHELTYRCVYEAVEDCCVPGVDECPLAPCEACLSDDGFEGRCGRVAPLGDCCLQTEGSQQAPVYGCDTTDPCARGACEDGRCRFGDVYADCCTEDADCDDPLQLTPCTGEQGQCVEVSDETGRGRCDYPRLDPDCCETDSDCQDRLPAEVGTCTRSDPGTAGTCSYGPNPEFCETEPPAVTITEVLIDPEGGYIGEWIELYNGLGTAVDLNGWRIEDLGDRDDPLYFVSEAPILIEPGRRLVVGHELDPALTGGVAIDYASYGAHMETGVDGLSLIDDEGRQVEFFLWDERFEIFAGRSLARTAPYAPIGEPSSWRPGLRRFGTGGRGTPGHANLDVYDPFAPSPPRCDDGDPCTLDLCHAEHENLCAHWRVPECCSVAGDPDCDDDDVCTSDACELEQRACTHTFDSGECCRTDGECPVAPPEMPLREAAAFANCTQRRCVNQSCLWVRNEQRPGCCISADHEELGCRDANPCTPDDCVPDAGVNEYGLPYPACVYALDTDGDGLNDCCDIDADCDDDDPATVERCLVGVQGTSSHTCERAPDADYCGPEAPRHDCDDGNPCTSDTCCQDIDDPFAGCPGTYRCLHEGVSDCCAVAEHCDDGDPCTQDICCDGPGDPLAGCVAAQTCGHEPDPTCCRSDEDCIARRSPEEGCLAARCFHRRCLFGPELDYDGCCVEDADCDDGDRCTVEVCVEGSCEAQGLVSPPACCYETAECPFSDDPCRFWICHRQDCLLIEPADCCTYAQEGTSAPCDDENPCTDDLCHAGRCLHTTSEREGCCHTVRDCPAPGAPCIEVGCDEETDTCTASPREHCVVALPFSETFWVHPAYRASLDFPLLGWTAAVSAGADPASWQLATDSELVSAPVARFAPAPGESGGEVCLTSPPIDTRDVTGATLQWRDVLVSGGGISLRIFVGADGDPPTYVTVWPEVGGGAVAFAEDLPPLWREADVPVGALWDERTHVTLCAAPIDPAAPPVWVVDEIVLAAGTPPEWASVPTDPVVAYAGNVRYAPLIVRDPGPAPDGSEEGGGVILVRLEAPPSFVGVSGPQRLPGDDGAVRFWIDLRPADLDVASYDPVTLIASDGALRRRSRVAIEIRSAFCGAAADCDDGDACTVGRCADDFRCYLYQPPDCGPKDARDGL